MDNVQTHTKEANSDSRLGNMESLTSSMNEYRHLVNNEGTDSMAMKAAHENALNQFYKAMGQITRTLHDATLGLSSVSEEPVKQDTAMTPYRENQNIFQYVRHITAKAANNTLNEIESVTGPLRQSIKQAGDLNAAVLQVKEDKNFSELSPPVRQSIDQLELFMNKQVTEQKTLLSTLDRIVVGHSYQDLTSQAVIKAEGVVTQTSLVLAELLSSFSILQDNEPSELGITAQLASGAELSKDNTKDDGEIELGQSEADALLAKLGF